MGNLTVVGTYAAAGHYGTFDQGGNVWEWNDAILSASNRGVRGGSYPAPDFNLLSGFRFEQSATYESNGIGFRVSSLEAIPEPSHAGRLIGALVLLMAWRVRGRRTR